MSLELEEQSIEFIENPLITELNSLKLNDCNDTHSANKPDSETPESSSKRTLRKRTTVDYYVKRRVTIKPQKRLSQSAKSTTELKEMYLSKKFIKLKPINLETIFEEPKVSNSPDIVVYTESKKKKRFISFEPQASYKQKKRQNKMKQVFGRKKLKWKHETMDALLQKLNAIE